MAGVRTTEMTDDPNVIGGDRQALESFFAAHYRRLVGLAGLMCGDVASAEDIVQTSLERARRARDTMRDDTRLRPWLDRIVVREAARERRSRMTWLGRLIRPHADAGIELPTREAVDVAADERLQTWRLDVGDAKVAIIIRSFPDTDPALVAEAEAVVESIVVEPARKKDPPRLVFRLEDGWDSG